MLATLREKNLVTPNKREFFLGILCWAMYEIGFPLLLPGLFDISTESGAFWFQITYFICSFFLTGGVLFGFLRRSFAPLRGRGKHLFLDLVQAVAVYYVLTLLFQWLALLITGNQLVTPNQTAVEGLLDYGLIPMAICSILLVPITEELLVRGVVFGTLCKRQPWLAYVVSTLLFAAMHTLSFSPEMTFLQFLGNFILYLPAGPVMGWMYQRTRTVIGPILLHMTINFLAVFGPLLFYTAGSFAGFMG